MIREPRPFALSALGGLMLVGSTVGVSMARLPDAPARTLWVAGVLAGFAFSVRAFLVWNREFTPEGALVLAVGSVGLFVLALAAHSLLFGVITMEEFAFIVSTAWIAPCMFVAAVIRMFHASGHRPRRSGLFHPRV